MKIVHITSAHPRYDTRIFVKQCQSLARAGHEVGLVVADGKGDETAGDSLTGRVAIVDVGAPTGRVNRIAATARQVVARAKSLQPDLVIAHDPELLPWMLGLQKGIVSPQGAVARRTKVVFDSHEDVPTQLLNKPYLHPWVLKVISGFYQRFERLICRSLDGLLTATPFIRDRLIRINPRTVDINNFPALHEFVEPSRDTVKQRAVCYIGGITHIRGAMELVQAMALVAQEDGAIRLNLAGAFENEALRATMQAHPGWSQVNELGFQDRQGVQTTLAQSRVGLVTLHPTPSYLEALPVKMFEYMASGLPVVASDFPVWAQIVNEAGCGLCVDPLDPKSIATAIVDLVRHPEQAQAMGERGRKAVLERYNWGTQESKLLAFVDSLS